MADRTAAKSTAAVKALDDEVRQSRYEEGEAVQLAAGRPGLSLAIEQLDAAVDMLFARLGDLESHLDPVLDRERTGVSIAQDEPNGAASLSTTAVRFQTHRIRAACDTLAGLMNDLAL